MQKNQVKHFPIFIKKKTYRHLPIDSLFIMESKFIKSCGIKKKSCNSKEFTLRKHCINMLLYSFIFPCQIPVTLQKSKSN